MLLLASFFVIYSFAQFVSFSTNQYALFLIQKNLLPEQERINMMGLQETVVGMTKASRVGWYEHVLQRDEGDALQRALEFEVDGKQKKGNQK